MKKKNNYIVDLISKMTLDQKVGAMMTLGFAGVVPKPHIYEAINKYHCGGFRLSPEIRKFGSYVDPTSGKTNLDVEDEMGFKYADEAPYCTPSEYKAVLAELQEIAMNRPLGIPLHFSYDQEGGTSADCFLGKMNLFAKPMGLRATGDSKISCEVAKAVAKQSKSMGINWIHSPVLDINVDPRNPEVYIRSYSDRVEEVVEYSEQTCRGFKESNMIATGKHFPGRGDSAIDAHFKLPIIDVDRETMHKRELLPYKNLIEKDLLPAVMIAHSIFPAYDPDNMATVSKKIITGLLREELGYNGVVTTDSMTMGAIAEKYGVAKACAMALEAGADLVLMKAENSLIEETFYTIKEFVEQGRISEEELNNKMYRILNLKYEYGLFHRSSVSTDVPEEVMNDPKIVELSKQVARKTVLVARDRHNFLPVARQEKILIVEQKVKNYNNYKWHSGILYENCLKHSENVDYLETAYAYDEQDKQNIKNRVQNYDVVVFTNFYMRDKLSNKEFINEIIKNVNTKVIVVTNTPYEEISIPSEADNVIVSFASAPNNIKVVADVLFGKINPEGVWPISYELKK